MEDNTLKDFPARYNAFLKEFGLTPTDLAERINDTPAKYYKYGKKDGPSPNLETIEKILAAFPDLSSEWFLRGIGSMRRSEAGEAPAPQPKQTGGTFANYAQEFNTIREALKEEMEERFTGVLAEKERTIQILQAMVFQKTDVRPFRLADRDTTDEEGQEGGIVRQLWEDRRVAGFVIQGIRLPQPHAEQLA